MMAQAQRNTFGAVALIGLGLLFLAGQVFGINFWEMVGFSWPALVLIPGVIFLALAFTGDKKMAGFAVPGMVISGTGAILWYQSATGNWESWAYVWTLYPALVGFALMFMGRRTLNEKEYTTGRGLVNYSLIAFIAAAAFFELFIFNDNGALTSYLLPLVLIGGGAFMLVSGRLRIGEKRKFREPTSESLFSDSEIRFATPAPKRSNGRLTASEKLRQEIDAALAEDTPNDPQPLV